MTDLLKHEREFEQHVEIQQVESARTDWHEARCTAGPDMDCWSTTGIRRSVEDAAREHIERDHSPHCPDCDAPPAPPTAAQPLAVNETFRAYVTGSAFRLDLGKTLIEALVHIDWVLRLERPAAIGSTGIPMYAALPCSRPVRPVCSVGA